VKSLNDVGAKAAAYVSALETEDYEGAKSLTRTLINELKELSRNPPPEEAGSFLTSALYLSVFFRALYDFACLISITSVPNWSQSEASLETAWEKLCDCKDRFAFARPRIMGPLRDIVASNLAEIDDFYNTNFGQGWYMSPELLVKRELCSICRQDMRTCSHISGRVYSGQICFAVADSDGIELTAGAIVRVPHDPRCRVWPWQMKNSEALGIKILSFFRIDDFMERDDWK